MDTITRKADELRELIYTSLRQLVEENQADFHSKIQELEQRLSITLDREQSTGKLLSTYQEDALAQRVLTQRLEDKLVDTRKEVEKLLALNTQFESILREGFGTTEFNRALEIIRETNGLIDVLRKQVATASDKIATLKSLLLEAHTVINEVVRTPESIPLLNRIIKVCE